MAANQLVSEAVNLYVVIRTVELKRAEGKRIFIRKWKNEPWGASFEVRGFERGDETQRYILNFDGEAMMHHVVFTNRARPDATCENRRERFFASGNERTAGVIPAGYGYRVRPGDSWDTLAHVMNLGDAARTLNIEITFYYAAADSGLSEVRPFWLDVDNCSDSEYSIPAGRSSTIWDFTATAELEGRIVAAAGHLHDDGVRIGLRNRTAGELLCTSRAGFDTEPSYLGHIEAMSACYGDPLARVGEGDVLRITSVYDSPVPQDDVMGIVLGYLAPA